MPADAFASLCGECNGRVLAWFAGWIRAAGGGKQVSVAKPAVAVRGGG